MGVGERIRYLLDEKGISQSELARRVGLRQSTINALINGTSQGSKHLHKIARELGTTPAYLSGETDNLTSDVPELRDLTPDEEKLLEIVRSMSAKDRAALKQLLKHMAGSNQNE